MALYMKQDFSPPLLSKKWIAMKFRPNMVLYNKDYVLSILESGLLFREDCVEVEQGIIAPELVWNRDNKQRSWLTKGEKTVSLVAVLACIIALPPNCAHRSTLFKLVGYVTVPLAVRTYHRWFSKKSCLENLLTSMRDYTMLARRAAACVKECVAVHKQLESMTSVIESTHTMLCRQQSELSVVIYRALSSLLGNAPWIKSDVAWEAGSEDPSKANLMQIHHIFLLLQSTLLKHIAIMHLIPPKYIHNIYKNYNERIYWLHTVVLEHLNEIFKENYETLDRMYRLLKNYDNKDTKFPKKPGSVINNSLLYSEVHNGVAKASLELRLALNKCTKLDMFLDTCTMNKQVIDLTILGKDIEDLVDGIGKSLVTVQSAQIRLKKLQNKFGPSNNDDKVEVTNIVEEENKNLVVIEDKDPEIKDEVFYYIKTDDENANIQAVGDVTVGPGKEEKETSKVVINELKRKLVKREDMMRERERQALVKTMPELKDNVPEFPRQINVCENDGLGYIRKLNRVSKKGKLFRHYKIQSQRRMKYITSYKLKISNKEPNVTNTPLIEVNTNLKCKIKYISISTENAMKIITYWIKLNENKKLTFDSSDMSERLSNENSQSFREDLHVNNVSNASIPNLRFSKKELELSPTSSDSEFEVQNMALLNDIRRERVTRKKNYPFKRDRFSQEVDENLKPVEYNFATGMALASVLQTNNKTKIPNICNEKTFIGDGEVYEYGDNDGE